MPDDYADRIASVAVELVTRVREDNPDDTGRWLRNTLTGEEWVSLAVVLATAVPLDKPWSHLTAWARMPRNDEAVAALTAERFAHVMPPDLPR